MNHGSPLENWLCKIRDTRRLHMDEIKKFEPGEDQVRRLVELNVVEQCLNVFKTSFVQKKRWDTKIKNGKAYPQVHGFVYDISQGELQPVKGDLKIEIQKLRECYDLYDFTYNDDEDALDL
eukprot:CAMPEP_0184319906 /NCGR_PEP_ID=MMETSP1049-20130417/111256_1 /TAXON_ID=77928 /ORGANISM="Proteomonas sulcata, Strain CCMP704" /LENGTH=120 /DNA_ID=CAMNT_0026640241 /DNA_START=26 /DNA_END=388 /DNA_ORIENTATION=+